MREIDERDMEDFGTLDSCEKTVAILGERWWPQAAKQEGNRIYKKFIWKQRSERPNVGGVSTRSRHGAPSRKGCMVNGQMPKKSNKRVRARCRQCLPETRRTPSRHCRDAFVYGHTTTAMHDDEYTPPRPGPNRWPKLISRRWGLEASRRRCRVAFRSIRISIRIPTAAHPNPSRVAEALMVLLTLRVRWS